MRNLHKKALPFAICYLLFATLGCTIIMEGAKQFVGISTKDLVDGRKQAIARTFNCDYNTCYDLTKETLQRMGAYIYAEDPGEQMIAIYISQEDTTPVGLFFREIDASKTQIEVSSPSTYAKEFISEKVFSSLEKALNPQKQKGRTDAGKEVRYK